MFDSENHCKRTCLSSTKPKQKMTKRNRKNYFFKNKRSAAEKCKRECGYQRNKFDSKKQCERKCLSYNRRQKNKKSRKTKGQRYFSNVTNNVKSSDEICKLGAEKGMCRGYFKKYFFDNKMKKCREFIYGGCSGNKNRFNSLKDCQKQCPS